jgi:transglutaminase-like putative cysteine protease
MRYRVTHATTYDYSSNVSLCHNVARLLVRDTRRQHCHSSVLHIEPPPSGMNEWTDLFGNRQVNFSIETPHDRLVVRATSEVELETGAALDMLFPVSWESAVEMMKTEKDADTLEARLYLLRTDFTEAGPEVVEYARASFPPGRSLIEGVEDLMHRINRDFTYDPGFSTIATPLRDVIAHKRGVCQDFAHFAIACLRSMGLAARYVSGYIETLPPEGKEKLVGVDASHAWFGVYVPQRGWMDFDPTNARIPLDQHITIAWGRDYADVAPLKGVVYGGGKHRLGVAVNVERL